MPSGAGCTGIHVSLSESSSANSVHGVERLESASGGVDRGVERVEGAVEGGLERRVNKGVDEEILDVLCFFWSHISAV
jgi:hypothetical protein